MQKNMEKNKVDFCNRVDSKKLVLSLDETVHELSSTLAKCQGELVEARGRANLLQNELWNAAQVELELLIQNDELKAKVEALQITNRRRKARLIRARRRIKVAWREFFKVSILSKLFNSVPFFLIEKKTR